MYTIIIYPLYQIVEFSYRVAFALSGAAGASIIAVSVAVTLLCLPLYAVAERGSKEEQRVQGLLAAQVARIKEAFRGDERYMMTRAYYREAHYSPIMALRKSLSLLIQIPFFIAAYNFLQSNKEIAGRSFLFIQNLALEDHLLFGLNLLPIFMTVINLIAGVIYTKDKRQLLQIGAMAVVFLIILYHSPSGLVLYWTMNNVFSLVKNIFYKLRHPKRAFYCLCLVSTIALTATLIFRLGLNRKTGALLAVIALMVLVGLASVLPKLNRAKGEDRIGGIVSIKASGIEFLLSAIAMVTLLGVVTPSMLMTSSIGEYCYLDGGGNPLLFLGNSFLQALGLCLFWPGVIYLMFGRKARCGIAIAFSLLITLSIVNTFGFQGNYGVVLPEVVFTEHRTFFPTRLEFLFNTLALVVASTVVLFLGKWKKTLLSIFLVGLILTGVVNIFRIGSYFNVAKEPELELDDTQKVIELSKTKKNVLVIMADRSTGYIIDPVFNANPRLRKAFTGFVKYPNTVAFGSWTIQGAPPLYGGYEYTPWAMNHRRDKPMREKHNEAISLLCNVFSQNGFTCTALDPPYPNYDKPPVFSAFENLSNTKAYSLIGKYNAIWCHEHGITPIPIRTRLIRRNFIWYSIFKAAPMILRPAIHYEEFWGAPKGFGGEDKTHFIDNYSVLDYLPRLTNFENDSPCFVIMDNEITHDEVFTQAPLYAPTQEVTDHGDGYWNGIREYHVNCALYLKLADYFNYLKKEGVYDNTRIIIVADHGGPTRMPQFPKSIAPDPIEKFNPVLMMKDFGATGDMRDDYTYMTHADTPAMATEGVIKAINPYTGRPIRMLSTKEKNALSVLSFSRANAVNETVNNGYKIQDSDWYTVKDNIFDINNWSHEMPEYKEY